MIGTTGLKGLRIEAIVGVYQHERERAQPLRVNVELDYDIRAAAATDDLAQALNYDEVAAELTELVQRRQYQLIETMAAEAVAMLLERRPWVTRVRIEIEKPDAVPTAACAFVQLERSR